MNAAVLEHVPVNELPAAWRAKLVSAPGDLVTVRIEAEAPNPTQNHSDQSSLADNPLVGMWRDRDDMADVGGYIRKLRASRFNDDGTANPA